MNTAPQRPPLSVKIIYALGQLGWSLAAYGAANLLVYFYMPSESGAEANFPTFIFQGSVLGLLTIIGILNFGGRIVDAITDPLIANWSDNTESSFGKRKKVMAIGILPFALFSFLIFYPPFTSAVMNGWWLAITLFLFYVAMTIYVIPYTALISELGHHPDDRMSISTIISVTWAMGFLIGNSVYAIQALLEDTISSTLAFQTVIAIFAILSFILMLIPLLFLNENKYCEQKIEQTSMSKSLSGVFKNRNFLLFTISDLMYWLALTFTQVGVSYYITILMGLEKEFATAYLGIGFLCSFLLYVPVNLLVKKIGKKRLLSIAFIVFSIIFGVTFSIHLIPIPKMILFYGLAILSAFPLASFGIIPNAIIADIVHTHEAENGEAQAGMFYAARNFMMKLGISIANLIFPSLLLLGKSVENPLGVQLSAVCAFVFCLLGFFIFSLYEEKIA